MMPDYPLGETLDFKFTTRAFATGLPTILTGSPAIEVYEDNDTDQITAGETLTANFDGVAGLNNLRIVATGANGYEAGKSYSAVISAGTVGGVTVIGEVVAQFSIERSPALRPTTAGRTLDVTATGEAGLDLDNTVGTLAAAQFASNFLTAAKINAGALNGKGDWNIGKTGYSLTQAFPTNFADLAIVVTTGLVSVGTMSANVIDAASIAASAMNGKGDWNIGKTGYALSAAGIDAIWDEDIVGAHGTADTSGLILSEFTKRSITFSTAVVDGSALRQMADDGTATFDRTTDSLQALADTGGGGPTAAAIADAVWDEAQADHVAAPSFGAIATEIALIPTTAMRGTDGVDTATMRGTDGVDTATMRGTDSAALATVCTELRLAELDGANLPTTTDNIETDTQDIQSRLPTALVGGAMDSDVSVLQADVITAAAIAAAAFNGKGDWNIGKTGYSLTQAFPTNFAAIGITAGGRVDGDVLAINGSTLAASQLALSAEQIENGAFEATPTISTLQTNLAEAQDDIYIGRVIIITSGAARGEGTDIIDYIGATGTLEVEDLANAPSAGDTFILI